MTPAEFTARMAMIREAPGPAAIRFMKLGESRWIDVSINEGWSATFRDIVQSWVREFVKSFGRLPAISEIDKAWSKISENEHRSYRGSPASLNGVWLDEITGARSAKRLTPRSRDMSGDR